MTEAQIQQAVVQHLSRRAKPNVIWFHPANGGKRSLISAVQFKRAGVVPGVADIICLRKGTGYALELKKMGGRVSEAQNTWLMKWEKAGGIWAIAYGLDAALAILAAWRII